MTTDTLNFATEALELARAELTEKLPEGSEITSDLAFMIEARATDTATFSLAAQYGSLVKSILYLMYLMELNGYYRVLPQEFSNLREWARFRFAKLFQMGTLSEDYIMRYCGTVENMLIPQHHKHLTGQSSVNPVELIAHASEAQLKETKFYYEKATPQQQEQLVTVLAQPAPTFGERKAKTAQLETIKESIREKTGITPIKLIVETTAEGRCHIEGTITFDDLHFIQGVLGKRLELHLAEV